MDSWQLIRLMMLSAVTFAVAIAWTPLFVTCAVSLQAWQDDSQCVVGAHCLKTASEEIRDAYNGWRSCVVDGALRCGGSSHCMDVCAALAAWRIEFSSRSQTLLPLGALLASALIGLVDDYLNIKRIGPHGGGMSILYRLGLYAIRCGRRRSVVFLQTRLGRISCAVYWRLLRGALVHPDIHCHRVASTAFFSERNRRTRRVGRRRTHGGRSVRLAPLRLRKAALNWRRSAPLSWVLYWHFCGSTLIRRAFYGRYGRRWDSVLRLAL